MHTVMIVDDEDIIREGLVNSIDWGKYGYKIAGQAHNGKSALEKARVIKPDIILTDIYMPVMDGIEFAKEIKKSLPEAVIIFLTGYNEFTYAQRAIEIGIFRYLTKPIAEEELLLALNEAAEDLDYKELEKNQIIKLETLIHESMPVLKERFFLNLVKDSLSLKEIQNKLEYLNINIDTDEGKYICMIINLDDFYHIKENMSEADLNLLKFAIQNISEELLEEINITAYTFEDKRNEIGVLMLNRMRCETEMYSSLQPNLKKIQDAVRKYLKTSVSFSIGRCYFKLADVSKSYKEAEAALEYKSTFGKNSIIYIEDIEESNKNIAYNASLEKVNELVKAVKGSNIEYSTEILSEMFDILKKENSLKKDHMHLIAIEIVNKLTRIVLEFGTDISEVYGEGFSPLIMLKYDILEDIHHKLLELTNKTTEFIDIRRKAVNRNFVEKAKEFINCNYMKEELSLSTIADNVHVSPNYLSQLFKQVVGESCVEYLSKVRMNQAKKMLKETTLKVYEVAFEIGFNDSQYFSTCFKKYVGVSPTDYRDIITKDILD